MAMPLWPGEMGIIVDADLPDFRYSCGCVNLLMPMSMVYLAILNALIRLLTAILN